MIATALLLVLGSLPAAQDEGELPLVVVERVGTVLDRDARVVIAPGVLATRGEEAAVIVRTNGVFLQFEDGVLDGAAEGTPPEEMDGIGLLIEARHVTIDGLRVRGYKVGILAREAEGVSLIDVSIEGGFRQRLGSTWEREDPADWLSPHHNDAREWRKRYGAGIAIEDTVNAIVSMSRIRGVQNGILLDRVEEAVISSNDASFLSGWGLAMWRTRTSQVVGNRFDFCVRGYSHGRYNRGQDSAGILLFEQCSDNTFERNTATHGGDGIFGFAGLEALGQVPAPRERFDYAKRGSNNNVFENNDLSYAAAHGLELTFSFGNTIRFNRLVGNAICGIWLGYGRDSLIEGNFASENSGGGYGSERGGLNAEHAQNLLVRGNAFEDQAVGVRFWTDPDVALAETPWVHANGRGARDIELVDNRFSRVVTAIELLETAGVRLAGNVIADARSMIAVRGHEPEEDRRLLLEAMNPSPPSGIDWEGLRAGRVPTSRTAFPGRRWIAIGPYGPHDWEVGAPWLQPLAHSPSPSYRLLAAPPAAPGPEAHAEIVEGDDAWTVESIEDVDAIAVGAWRLVPTGEPDADAPGRLAPYTLAVSYGDQAPLFARGAVLRASWTVRAFPTPADPRNDEAAFERAASDAKVVGRYPALDFEFRFGPAHGFGIADERARELGLDHHHFGVRATTKVALDAGRYVVRTVSDDGVRVRADGDIVFEDWTHHASRVGEAILDVTEAREVEFVVDYFQLQGAAELRFELVAVP